MPGNTGTFSNAINGELRNSGGMRTKIHLLEAAASVAVSKAEIDLITEFVYSL